MNEYIKIYKKIEIEKNKNRNEYTVQISVERTVMYTNR